ncbi:alpha/beta hydrolase fold domain-containing protein [Brevibacillus thermoruber]|uniref:alpha/beta hydrolase fold domain-containing protein n=1 Tax=Brevibacillus thermoruber TaxID=33942 RepID=UPI0009E02099|nr:alpha/beta hydrolase [Brevibacillus thermoruber]
MQILLSFQGGGSVNAQTTSALPHICTQPSPIILHNSTRSLLTRRNVVRVYHYLCSHGYSPKNIGIIGDSAGGGLALALLLRLKELHTELPAANGLLSPWADLNLSGDTMTTLSEVDPILRKEPLSACAKLYVQEEDVQNPLVSPVYGDFTGFPPMMMITGSREIRLSDTLRIAQKALNDQGEVRFEIVEGLWHVFCADPSLPESHDAIGKLASFFTKHLTQEG